MKYNQPPIPMSSELKDVLQSSLDLKSESELTNVLKSVAVDNENKPPNQTFLDIDNYCWGTLNQEAVLLKCGRMNKIQDADAKLIDKAGLHDLYAFVQECKG